MKPKIIAIMAAVMALVAQAAFTTTASAAEPTLGPAYEMWEENWEHVYSYEIPYQWELNSYQVPYQWEPNYLTTHYRVSIEALVPLDEVALDRTLQAIAAVGAEYQTPFQYDLRVRISFNNGGGGLSYGEGRVWINRRYLSGSAHRRSPLQFERLVAHEVSHTFMKSRANYEGITPFKMLLINEWLADYAAFRAVGKHFSHACGSSASRNPVDESIRMTRNFEEPYFGCDRCHRQYGIPKLFKTEKILGGEDLIPRLRLLHEQSATVESLTWSEFVDGLTEGGTEEQRAEVRKVWETLIEWQPSK